MPRHSMEAMRSMAWKVFGEVVETVPFQSTLIDGRVVQGTVPRFLTWMSVEDMQRWLRFALKAAPRTQVETGVPFSAEQMQAADALWLKELDNMPAPLQNRLQQWLLEHPEPNAADAGGVGGTSRVYYSPGFMQTVLRHYADLGRCFQGLKRPPALGDDQTCFTTALPSTSVIVKAAWTNAKSAFKAYATDAESLATLMQTPGSSWAQAARVIPVPDSVFRVNVGKEQLLLPGLHIMTKDQNDWFWLTAFWSADPDTDFGADRPESVHALGAPFSHYKICAVAAFHDEAEDLDALGQKYPDLIAAFRAAQGSGSNASWCSNPYLELGVDNQKTNCMGCHQFAGTDARIEAIVPVRDQQRTHFVTDYVWSVGSGGQSLFNVLDSNLVWRLSLGD